MMHPMKSLSCVAAVALWSQAATAQMSAPPIPSELPGISRISTANAVGVLKFCQQKTLVSNSATDAVLDALASKPDVKSADYAAGARGEILGDNGKNYSIAGAPGYLQSQACNLVLEHAKTLRKEP